MVQWASEYERTEGGCKVSYRSLGSDGGVKFILERKVDFGCTDGPMTDEELAKARAGYADIVHVPLVLGAVVPAYNLAEVKDPLRFSGTVLADIFLGKIKRWNDRQLQELNPGVNLPDKEIRLVHRLDGSGTTYIWSDYLSKVSPEWRKGPGTATELAWPTGAAESGNEGVATYIKQNSGTLGYVELAYAYRLELSFGLVQNREGEFTKASLESVKTAAHNALTIIPSDLRFSITDASGKDSYPICGTTWAVVYRKQTADKGKELVAFLRWVLGEGQENAETFFYAKLPDSLIALAREKIDLIEVGK